MRWEQQHRLDGQTLVRRDAVSKKFADQNGSVLQAQVCPSPPTPLPEYGARGARRFARGYDEEGSLESITFNRQTRDFRNSIVWANRLQRPAA